ncbi:MAG: PilZ domain-containing protein [Deltaproteobacteria bacterium]|nr:PilZ domain-containing protein [Deltaproteobacteria bacterium]
MKDLRNEKNVMIERRENQRFNNPAVVTCKFINKNMKGKKGFQGFIQNISLGGVALEIRDDFSTIDDPLLQYAIVQMVLELNLSSGTYKMKFSGFVKWLRRVKKEGVGFLYLGIQFSPLNESSKEILMEYLSLGTGDKNLIWNLWDNLSIQDLRR